MQFSHVEGEKQKQYKYQSNDRGAVWISLYKRPNKMYSIVFYARKTKHNLCANLEENNYEQQQKLHSN